MDSTPNQRLITTKEAAARLGVTERTVCKWVKAGILPARTVPYSTRPRYRFRPSDIEAFIERMQQHQNDETPDKRAK